MAFTRLYAAIIIMAATIGPESIKMAFFGSPINKENASGGLCLVHFDATGVVCN